MRKKRDVETDDVPDGANRGRGVLPTYFCLPHHLGWGANETRPGIYSGWLGKQFDPLCSQPVAWYEKDAVLHDWQNIPTTMGYPRLSNEKTVSRRLNQRWDLRTALDRGLGQHVDKDSGVTKFNRRHEQAFELLTTNRVRGAFDLTRESEKTRELYGPSLFGNSCLVARRLVEAGSTFVSVNWEEADSGNHWDLHANNFNMCRHHLPILDQMFTTLVDDLDQRGLLKTTLVVLMGEMGRTPRINGKAGRDHWPQCGFVVLAGGGTRPGVVLGKTDKQAAYPVDRPVSAGDLAATMGYHGNWEHPKVVEAMEYVIEIARTRQIATEPAIYPRNREEYQLQRKAGIQLFGRFRASEYDLLRDGAKQDFSKYLLHIPCIRQKSFPCRFSLSLSLNT